MLRRSSKNKCSSYQGSKCYRRINHLQHLPSQQLLLVLPKTRTWCLRLLQLQRMVEGEAPSHNGLCTSSSLGLLWPAPFCYAAACVSAVANHFKYMGKGKQTERANRLPANADKRSGPSCSDLSALHYGSVSAVYYIFSGLPHGIAH